MIANNSSFLLLNLGNRRFYYSLLCKNFSTVVGSENMLTLSDILASKAPAVGSVVTSYLTGRGQGHVKGNCIRSVKRGNVLLQIVNSVYHKGSQLFTSLQ